MYPMKVFILLFISFVLIISDPNIIKTEDGLIQGFVKENVRSFIGIPYARPPLGEFRFKTPKPNIPWTNILNATTIRNVCLQPSTRSTPPNEDCLYLNIHVPISRDSKLPVMIWFHGGSYVHGSGDLYDGDHISRNEKAIVVTVNYRLGLLGFLYVEELEKDEPTGLYGVLDQRAAIAWVKRNIENFGGDSNQITIFGESAGGTSILFHLVSPKSFQFYNRAIVQSGTTSYFTKQQARFTSVEVLRKLGCTMNVAECLRRVSSADIIRVQKSIVSTSINSMPIWRPVLHSEEFPLDYMEAFKSGRFNKVPVLIGANLNEACYFLCPQYQNLTIPQYYALTALEYGFERGRKIIEFYNANEFPSPKMAASDLVTDYMFKCPARNIIDEISKYVSSYLYNFEFFSGYSNSCFGVAHAYELPYIFPNVLKRYFGNYQLKPHEEEFGKKMLKMWVEFVSGNTNGFIKYSSENSQFTIINKENTIQTNYRNRFCEFWNKL